SETDRRVAVASGDVLTGEVSVHAEERLVEQLAGEAAELRLFLSGELANHLDLGQLELLRVLKDVEEHASILLTRGAHLDAPEVEDGALAIIHPAHLGALL